MVEEHEKDRITLDELQEELENNYVTRGVGVKQQAT